MKLNIGCGDDYREGWVNADVRSAPALKVDDVIDIRWPSYESETFDEVLAQDVLEHVQRHEVEETLSELHRVLKVAGKLCVRVPNLLYWASRICANPLGVAQAIEAIYGEQDYEQNCHKCGFTEYSLRTALKTAGFTKIEVRVVNGGCNLQALCRKEAV